MAVLGPRDLEFKIGTENTHCSACFLKDEAWLRRWLLRRDKIWSRWPSVHIPQYLPQDWTCAVHLLDAATSVWSGIWGLAFSSCRVHPSYPLMHAYCIEISFIVFLQQTRNEGAGCERARSAVGDQIERRRGFKIRLLNVWARTERGGMVKARYTPSVGKLLVWVPCEKGKSVTHSSSGFIFCSLRITLKPGKQGFTYWTSDTSKWSSEKMPHFTLLWACFRKQAVFAFV